MTVGTITGENAAMMRRAIELGEIKFTLAYLDPPFFTGRDFETTSGEHAYSDKWESLEAYLDALLERAALAYQLLTDSGSIVIHVDPTVSHYVKVRCDAVFGRDNFASEIVWRYRRWPAQRANFQAMHDVLLRYVTGRAPAKFNQLFEPLAPSTTRTFKQAKQWAVEREGERGKSRWKSQGTDELSPGAALSDVWEIPIVAPSGNERTGYPTQKPEALLEQIVLSLTNEGDSVLDPYMGSGTTLSVCHRLGRHVVGIDNSEVAHRVTNERLEPLLAQGNLFSKETA